MNVLSLSQLLMPDNVGGTGRYARLLAEALVANGVVTTAVTQRIQGSASEHEAFGDLTIERYGSAQLRALIGQNAAAALGIRRRLPRILAEARYDVALGHQPAASVAAAGILNGWGIPELRFFHASGALERERQLAPAGPRHLKVVAASAGIRAAALRAHWQLERSYVRNATHLCFLSKHSKQLAVDLHGPEIPESSIIAAGVDVRRFSPARDREGLRRAILGDHSDEVLLFTARNLTARMGLDVLIQAVPALRREDSRIRMVIAGDGPLRAQLESSAARLGVADAVTFLGRVTDKELVRWYRAADLFVLPTLELEGFGMATVEALACGTPVVGTPVGATPDVLGRFPELLTAGANADDLAHTIINLVRRSDINTLRSEVRAYALEQYDMERQARRVIEVLSRLAPGARDALETPSAR